MKALWNILCIVCVANVLAVVGFVGWLMASGRLDKARLQEARTLFAETTADRDARLKADADRVEAEKKAAEQAAKDARPTMTAEEKLAARVEVSELDSQRSKSVASEAAALQIALREQLARLDAARRDLARERADFEAMRKRVAQEQGDAQFRRAVGVLEGLDPKPARTTLNQLITAGKDGSRQAVAYLNAMDERKRTDILAEFAKSDPALAADLLERLRTFGLVAQGPEVPPK